MNNVIDIPTNQNKDERIDIFTHEDPLTPRELARVFSVSEGVVYKWAREGHVPKLPLPGSIVRFDPEVIRELFFTGPNTRSLTIRRRRKP